MNSDSSSKHHRNPVTWVKDKLNLGSSDRLVKSEPIQKQRAQSPPKAKPTIEPTWENLWECAYDKLSGTSSELLKEYGENLRKIQAGDSTDTKDAADNSADKSGSIKTEDKLPTAAEGSLVSFEVVKSTITTLSERRETKQWRLQFSAKLFEVDIGARNQLENLLKLVKWSDDLVKQALSSQPHAALAWTGATMLVSLVQEFMGQCDEMLAGFNAVANTQVYWRVCEQACLADAKGGYYKDMMLQLVDVYTSILEYQATAVNHLSKRQLNRAVSTHNWKSLAKSILDLDTEARRLVPLTQCNVIQSNWKKQLDEIHKSNEALQGIHAILYDTLELQEKAAKNDLLNLLSDKPYSTKLNDVEARVPGTLEWFLNDNKMFEKWRGSGTSDILWVSAGPGFGKSVLSKSLIQDRLLSTKVFTTNVAHFFFKAGDPSRSNKTDAICALLYQLLKHDLSGKLLQNAMTNQHAQGNKSLGQNFEQLWGILVQVASAPTSGEIILVLDGLDECTRDDRKDFLGAVQTFLIENQKKDSTVLKFLITSRPYDDFMLDEPNNLLKDYITHFSISDVSKDIDLVINARVNAMASEISANERKAIAKHLRRGNNRTYLWLSLTFKYINSNPILFKRAEDFDQQLEKLPDGIEDAYVMLLSKVQDKERSLVLLQIVAGSKRPLTVLEANYALALALSPGKFGSHETVESKLFPGGSFEDVIRNYSGFMIEIFDDKLSFLHATAQEFLTTPLDEAKATEGGKKITLGRKHWQNILGRENPHNTLSKICINYLLTLDCHYIRMQWELKTDYPLLKAKYPFSQFALDYWPQHFDQQDEHYVKPALSDAMTLCHPSRSIPMKHGFGYLYPMLREEDEESTSSDTQCLLTACLIGVYRVVDHILSTSTSVDVNKRFEDDAPLSWAITRGYHEVVERLLVDPRVKVRNSDLRFGGSTFNIPRLLEHLIEHLRSDPFGNECPGVDILWHACESGDLTMLNLLLEVPAIGIYVKGRVGMEALEIALSQNDKTFNIYVIKKLLDTIDASAYDDAENNLDPLLTACVRERKDAVELLVKTPGVDINKGLDDDGKTSLMYAILLGSEALVKTLLGAKDIEVDLVDKHGLSALLWSVVSSDPTDPNPCNGPIGEALRAANNIQLDDKINAIKTVRKALLDIREIYKSLVDGDEGLELQTELKAFNRDIKDYKGPRPKLA